jgi:DNA-binding LacI/PurR family transcriptional regulator
MSPKATLAQVAALSGYSIATVSRAFAHPSLLNPETLRSINEAAEILRYRISGANASLTAENRVGVFVNLFQDLYSVEILRGITNALRSWNFELVLFEAFDLEKEFLAARKVAAKTSLNAVIFIGRPLHSQTLPILDKAGIPIVLLDHQESEFPQVFSPIEPAMDAVYDHLVNSGTEKLLFIGNLPENSEAKEAIALSRLRKLNQGLRKMTISEILLEPNRIPGSVELVRAIQDEKPDAVFASSDFLAVQVYRGCLNMRLVVPDDIQIIGYGDVDMAKTLELSSVRTFLDAQGRRAAEIIYSQIIDASPLTVRHTERIAPELIHRKSTRKEVM